MEGIGSIVAFDLKLLPVVLVWVICSLTVVSLRQWGSRGCVEKFGASSRKVSEKSSDSDELSQETGEFFNTAFLQFKLIFSKYLGNFLIFRIY
ncbi:MAG: hypothetical protein JSR80_02160 [Verrucomicrobia bacterium]|nr:hypothetical protein [Verrucomicrobiota bacterium]